MMLTCLSTIMHCKLHRIASATRVSFWNATGEFLQNVCLYLWENCIPRHCMSKIWLRITQHLIKALELKHILSFVDLWSKPVSMFSSKYWRPPPALKGLKTFQGRFLNSFLLQQLESCKLFWFFKFFRFPHIPWCFQTTSQNWSLFLDCKLLKKLHHLKNFAISHDHKIACFADLWYF
jgi:hypothetical protein